MLEIFMPANCRKQKKAKKKYKSKLNKKTGYVKKTMEIK